MSRNLLPFLGALLIVSPCLGQTQVTPGGPVPAQKTPATPASFAPSGNVPILNRPELPGLAPPAKTTEPAPPALLPQTLIEPRRRFDPQATAVKQVAGHWQLWSGRTMLKDFGEQREHAYQARKLVADLSLNEHGAIGTPDTVMEYWLSNGTAPYPPSFARDVIPFDPSKVRVDKYDGAFLLRDEHQVLFNFGPYEADAKLGLTVLQRYGFNELGLIGAPNPTMTYLIKNPSPRAARLAPETPFAPRMAPQQTVRHSLTLPKLGVVGERVPFDPMRADIYKTPDGWRLISGPRDLGSVGANDYAARQSLQMVVRYPLNEYVRIGASTFGFYLSRGQAPHGVPVGVRHASFDPKALTAKQVGDQWIVGDGKTVVATFNADQAMDAKLTVQVLQHYGFDAQCDVAGGLHYLAKER